jgi:hypothetical protein
MCGRSDIMILSTDSPFFVVCFHKEYRFVVNIFHCPLNLHMNISLPLQWRANWDSSTNKKKTEDSTRALCRHRSCQLHHKYATIPLLG